MFNRTNMGHEGGADMKLEDYSLEALLDEFERTVSLFYHQDYIVNRLISLQDIEEYKEEIARRVGGK